MHVRQTHAPSINTLNDDNIDLWLIYRVDITTLQGESWLFDNYLVICRKFKRTAIVEARSPADSTLLYSLEFVWKLPIKIKPENLHMTLSLLLDVEICHKLRCTVLSKFQLFLQKLSKNNRATPSKCVIVCIAWHTTSLADSEPKGPYESTITW